MDTMEAFAKAEAARAIGTEMRVFDWNKAATRILQEMPTEASAGLSQDWEWTGGKIWEDSKPVPSQDTYTYLASNWATPELDMDGAVEDCFIMDSERPKEWGDDPAKVYWPQSALDILKGA